VVLKNIDDSKGALHYFEKASSGYEVDERGDAGNLAIDMVRSQCKEKGL
jgi:hypothetical protein